VVWIDAGEQATETDVIVGLEGGVPPPLELPPHAEANRSGTLKRSASTKRRFCLFFESRRDRKVIFHSPTNLQAP
jgi:hypothetical protein